MALSPVEKAMALSQADLMQDLGADDLLQLATVAEERTFSSGEYLFYEGDQGDYMYVVLEGHIRAELGGQEVEVVGPGQAIGTFAILDRHPRSAGALALEPTRTLALHRDDFAQIMADNFSLVEGMFDYLTGIIRHMNAEAFSAQDGANADQPEES